MAKPKKETRTELVKRLASRVATQEATILYSLSVIAVAAPFGHFRKTWVSFHDSRVRSAHEQASGQTVPLGRTFIVGGYAMRYPGDSIAPPELTKNCRCVIVTS